MDENINSHILKLVTSDKFIKKILKEDGVYKKCTNCKRIKMIKDFGKRNDGTRGECKICQKSRNKNYYEHTKDRLITCECGKQIKYSNRYEHKKSKKHIKIIFSLNSIENETNGNQTTN